MWSLTLILFACYTYGQIGENNTARNEAGQQGSNTIQPNTEDVGQQPGTKTNETVPGALNLPIYQPPIGDSDMRTAYTGQGMQQGAQQPHLGSKSQETQQPLKDQKETPSKGQDQTTQGSKSQEIPASPYVSQPAMQGQDQQNLPNYPIYDSKGQEIPNYPIYESKGQDMQNYPIYGSKNQKDMPIIGSKKDGGSFVPPMVQPDYPLPPILPPIVTSPGYWGDFLWNFPPLFVPPLLPPLPGLYETPEFYWRPFPPFPPFPPIFGIPPPIPPVVPPPPLPPQPQQPQQPQQQYTNLGQVLQQQQQQQQPQQQQQQPQQQQLPQIPQMPQMAQLSFEQNQPIVSQPMYGQQLGNQQPSVGYSPQQQGLGIQQGIGQNQPSFGQPTPVGFGTQGMGQPIEQPGMYGQPTPVGFGTQQGYGYQ